MKSVFNRLTAIIKHNPLIALLVALLAISLFIIFFIQLLLPKNQAKLELIVAPSAATVKLNGKVYKNGFHQLPPATYQVEFTHASFQDHRTTITLHANQVNRLFFAMSPKSGHENYYKNHPEDEYILRTLSDVEADQKSQDFSTKYPIIAILPIVVSEYDRSYNLTEYRIDGGSFPDCQQDFCIKITDTTGGNRETALNHLRSTGHDPSKYQIIYVHTPIQPLPLSPRSRQILQDTKSAH